MENPKALEASVWYPHCLRLPELSHPPFRCVSLSLTNILAVSPPLWTCEGMCAGAEVSGWWYSPTLSDILFLSSPSLCRGCEMSARTVAAATNEALFTSWHRHHLKWCHISVRNSLSIKSILDRIKHINQPSCGFKMVLLIEKASLMFLVFFIRFFFKNQWWLVYSISSDVAIK